MMGLKKQENQDDSSHYHFSLASFFCDPARQRGSMPGSPFVSIKERQRKRGKRVPKRAERRERKKENADVTVGEQREKKRMLQKSNQALTLGASSSEERADVLDRFL